MRKLIVLALLFAVVSVADARGNNRGHVHGYAYGLGVGVVGGAVIYGGYRTYYPPVYSTPVYISPPVIYYPPVYYEQPVYYPPQESYYPQPQQGGCTTWHWAQDRYGNWIKQLDC